MRENVNIILLSVSTALATLCWLAFVSPNATLNTAETETTEMINKATSQEPFIGEVTMFGGTFAPRGWAFCNGQLLPIAQNEALFALLGTMYGGDGRTTFALPDLRGRLAVHAGYGPGLNPVQQGQKYGVESSTPLWIPTELKTAKDGGAISAIIPQQESIDREQPSLGINYIIALRGVFPSRS